MTFSIFLYCDLSLASSWVRESWTSPEDISPGVACAQMISAAINGRPRNQSRNSAPVRVCLIPPDQLGRAVALFIFLSRAARARIVATDFWLIAHYGFDLTGFFARRRRALVWAGKVH